MCVFFLTLIVTEQACALNVPSRISHGAVLQAMQDTWEDLGLHNNLTTSDHEMWICLKLGFEPD